jgi:hypothetical protein
MRSINFKNFTFKIPWRKRTLSGVMAPRPSNAPNDSPFVHFLDTSETGPLSSLLELLNSQKLHAHIGKRVWILTKGVEHHNEALAEEFHRETGVAPYALDQQANVRLLDAAERLGREAISAAEFRDRLRDPLLCKVLDLPDSAVHASARRSAFRVIGMEIALCDSRLKDVFAQWAAKDVADYERQHVQMELQRITAPRISNGTPQRQLATSPSQLRPELETGVSTCGTLTKQLHQLLSPNFVATRVSGPPRLARPSYPRILVEGQVHSPNHDGLYLVNVVPVPASNTYFSGRHAIQSTKHETVAVTASLLCAVPVITPDGTIRNLEPAEAIALVGSRLGRGDTDIAAKVSKMLENLSPEPTLWGGKQIQEWAQSLVAYLPGLAHCRGATPEQARAQGKELAMSML